MSDAHAKSVPIMQRNADGTRTTVGIVEVEENGTLRGEILQTTTLREVRSGRNGAYILTHEPLWGEGAEPSVDKPLDHLSVTPSDTVVTPRMRMPTPRGRAWADAYEMISWTFGPSTQPASLEDLLVQVQMLAEWLLEEDKKDELVLTNGSGERLRVFSTPEESWTVQYEADFIDQGFTAPPVRFANGTVEVDP